MQHQLQRQRAEAAATARAAATAAFSRNGDTTAGGGTGSVEYRALKVEATRLHRENTRLHTELSSRSDGSYSSLQVQNARLVREVTRLQLELRRSTSQVNQLQDRLSGNFQVGATVDAEIQCSLPWVSSLPGSPSRSRTTSPVPGRSSSPVAMRASSGSPNDSRASSPSPSVPEDKEEEEGVSIEIRAPGLPPKVTTGLQLDWSEHGGDLLEPTLRSGAYALVDAAWLVQRSEDYQANRKRLSAEVITLRAQAENYRTESEAGQKARAALNACEDQLSRCLELDVLPPRNELPTVGIAGIEALKAAGCPSGGLPILVVSCPWITPYHPGSHSNAEQDHSTGPNAVASLPELVVRFSTHRSKRGQLEARRECSQAIHRKRAEVWSVLGLGEYVPDGRPAQRIHDEGATGFLRRCDSSSSDPLFSRVHDRFESNQLARRIS